MRIDKFLKVSRIIKRRTIAQEMASQQRIKVNDRIAKPSTKVELGDIVEIQFGKRIIKVKVSELLDTTKKEKADEMYEMISEQPL